MCPTRVLPTKKPITLFCSNAVWLPARRRVHSGPQFDVSDGSFYDTIACADLSHLDIIYPVFLHDLYQVARPPHTHISRPIIINNLRNQHNLTDFATHLLCLAKP
jgi:hypothetical protein